MEITLFSVDSVVPVTGCSLIVISLLRSWVKAPSIQLALLGRTILFVSGVNTKLGANFRIGHDCLRERYIQLIDTSSLVNCPRIVRET